MKVFCNARLVERESLEEIFEPGFLFGWGTFETLRAYKRKVPFLDLHIKRLNRNLSVLGIEEVNLDFKGAIRALLNENNLDDAYLRITAYKKRESTGIIIYADKFGYYHKRPMEKDSL
jgi:branched-subunit amino acid aminotransferase/4-amino-4-deoxychorismate lyase